MREVGRFSLGSVGSVAVVSYHDLRILEEGTANRAISKAFE